MRLLPLALPTVIQETMTIPLGTQNQPEIDDGVESLDDVRTVDNANGAVAGEIDGDPANGEREASAFLDTNLSTEIAPQALLTVLKQSTTVDRGPTQSPSDDLITYRIDARVESNSSQRFRRAC